MSLLKGSAYKFQIDDIPPAVQPYSYYIETARTPEQLPFLKIETGYTPQTFLFTHINRFLRKSKGGGRAGLHLYEYNLPAFLSHNIYLTQGAAEISLPNVISLCFKKSGRYLLTLPAFSPPCASQ